MTDYHSSAFITHGVDRRIRALTMEQAIQLLHLVTYTDLDRTHTVAELVVAVPLTAEMLALAAKSGVL